MAGAGRSPSQLRQRAIESKPDKSQPEAGKAPRVEAKERIKDGEQKGRREKRRKDLSGGGDLAAAAAAAAAGGGGFHFRGRRRISVAPS
ncbi:hypothetical protein ACJRO7_007596 [Eucalyptus globulus]|uniref:Small EDRK-rich factor-like N-terminal domain-containing protein n=1 Tax=Eucalyptus globulus TaxID=34317 RepID=A0ABD3ILK5_EUCGL